MKLSALVAYDQGGLIGWNDKLPWRMSTDLKLFKERTVGRVCIVGRKTYDTMPILTDRSFIIVSSTLPESDHADYQYDPFTTTSVKTLEHAIQIAKELAEAQDHEEAFIIGGAELYKAAMPYLDRIYATEIAAYMAVSTRHSPAYFPRIAWELWTEARESRIFIPKGPRDEYMAVARVYDRVRD